MIRLGVKIDTRELSRATARLRSQTKESKADLANSNAKFIAIRAYRGTDKTTAGRIRDELGQNRGQYTLAEMIVASRARRTGNWPEGKGGVKRAARQLIAQRAQSAGWLKVGFLPAIRKFGGRGAQAKRFRQYPGSASRARRSLRRAVAVIEHYDKGFMERHPNLLQQAADRQALFMERLAQKKMREAIRRAGR